MCDISIRHYAIFHISQYNPRPLVRHAYCDCFKELALVATEECSGLHSPSKGYNQNTKQPIRKRLPSVPICLLVVQQLRYVHLSEVRCTIPVAVVTSSTFSSTSLAKRGACATAISASHGEGVLSLLHQQSYPIVLYRIARENRASGEGGAGKTRRLQGQLVLGEARFEARRITSRHFMTVAVELRT